jgi:hypothetical protein
VIAIAIAQYQPPDVETTPFNPTSITLDGEYSDVTALRFLSLRVADDPDDESYDSEEDEDYSSEKEINFTDLAARPSSVRVDVSARTMLELQSGFLKADGKRVSCNPLQTTIYDDDFEAFVRALELYQFAGVALWPDAVAHELVVALDRPDMLDELTRRTGVGIPIPSDTAKNPNATQKESVEERVYLGLKVGGKRRSNIAQQVQKVPMTYNYDLLRAAIYSGSTKVVEYLAGPRPIAAYTHYATTHSDDIAQHLKGLNNLEEALPGLLGWKVDELNQSPLLLAVINDKLDILKQLFALKPILMEEALHQRYGLSRIAPL